jgi:predicted Rossmann fold nucleotide-binding protein DprA/Smf involved in DNA uptake
MARNKIIYCLSEVAVVAATTRDQGGTWAGATECLRHGWVPVLVNRSTAPGSGAAALVEKGARWLPPLPLVVSETSALALPIQAVPVAEGRASKVGRTAKYRWRAAMAQGALFE